MKKLVQINVTCNGSTGRIMNQIQQTAENEGWEAYSFFGRGKPANEKCYKITNMVDVLYSVFLTRVFGLHGYGCKRATKKLIKNIEKIDPDVIQLHNIHGYYINIKLLFEYLKRSNKKIIWTLHDCWAFTGKCAYFTMNNCNKWKEDCKNCLYKEAYPRSIFFTNSKRQLILKKELFLGIKDLTIITPSNWLANLVNNSFLKEYKVEVINNGIDLQSFKPTTVKDVKKKYNIPNNKKIILGVAAVWDKRKGLEDFLKLSAKLDENKIIVLVGLNKKQNKKLPSNIIGIERTENIEELASLYSVSDFFVNLTIEDNFPTTNLEALACGTYVITYDVGGSGECINENCGKKVEKNNIDKVNDIINSNININKEKCVEQGRKYNGNKKYLEYMKIYNKKEE